MAVIGVLIDSMFEDVEYTKPAQAFVDAGHTLVHIGLEKGKTVRGKSEGTQVLIDRAADDVRENEIDALFIPGGYSPDRLRAHQAPIALVRRFADTGKPMLVLCHGPQLLISARVLEGKKVTGWRSIIPDIKYAGGEFVDEPVVVDGPLVSSRQPSDIPQFIGASLKKLGEMALTR